MSQLFLEYSGGEAAPGPQGLGGCVCRVSRRRDRVRSVLLSCPGGYGPGCRCWGTGRRPFL